MYGYKLRFEPSQGSGKADDTAANSLVARCKEYGDWRTPTTEIRIDGPFGVKETALALCPVDTLVVAIKARVEAKQGDSDDTALNDVMFYCGRITEGE